MPPRAIGLDLVPATVGAPLNRVQIQQPAVTVAQRDRRWQPVTQNFETGGGESTDELIDAVDNKVEIGVVPRLSLEQGVDAPAAVDPGRDGQVVQPFQGRKHLIAPHVFPDG